MPTYIHRYLHTYLLIPWLYSPLRALASLITDANSSVSAALCRHLLTSVSLKSFSKSSNYLNLGLPILLLPTGFLSNIFLSSLPWCILSRRRILPSLFFSLSALVSESLYSSRNFWLQRNSAPCWKFRFRALITRNRQRAFFCADFIISSHLVALRTT